MLEILRKPYICPGCPQLADFVDFVGSDRNLVIRALSRWLRPIFLIRLFVNLVIRSGESLALSAFLGEDHRHRSKLRQLSQILSGGGEQELALTKAVTRLSDRADPVPDDVWNEAARHYDEKALAALILSITTTNVFNRLNVSTRQVAGAWKP
jgi:hypothetical protein